MTNLNTPELQGALDCLAMLLLQPEAENAVQAIPFAAEALLILGKDTLPQDSQEALTSIAEKPTVEPVELQKAYARLFLGIGEVTIPLCESAWTSGDTPLLCQKPQDECRTLYEAEGLSITGDNNIPEDHLGAMLGFSIVLLLKDKTEKVRDFFAKHPAAFIPAVVKAVRAEARKDDPYLDVMVLLEALADLMVAKH